MRNDDFEGESTTATFLFEIDDVEIGKFKEATGLEMAVEIVEFGEGGVNGYVHQFPGRLRWPNLVLRRGLTNSDALFSWVYRSAGEGFEGNSTKLTRNTGAITIVDQKGKRLRAWEVEAAFAVSWKGPRFATDGVETPIEELEIAHHGFRSRKV